MVGEGLVDEEFENRAGRRQALGEGLGPLRAQERIGIVAARQLDDRGRHPFGEEELHGAKGRLAPRRILVEEELHLSGVTLEEAHLLQGQGGSAGGCRRSPDR